MRWDEERNNLSFLVELCCFWLSNVLCLSSALKNVGRMSKHWTGKQHSSNKKQKLFRFSSQFSSFFTTKLLFKCHFVGLTKAIIPRICRLCVCVLINKPSFEHFVFRCCFRTLAAINCFRFVLHVVTWPSAVRANVTCIVGQCTLKQTNSFGQNSFNYQRDIDNKHIISFSPWYNHHG